jgi:hypothetical protein
VLLAAPFIPLLWVSSYARYDPSLFGFPFFYWYQLLWVLLGAALVRTAHWLLTTDDRARDQQLSSDIPGGGGR